MAQLEKVRIEYRAPPECPDVDAFKDLVASRVSANWEAASGEFARRVVVHVSSVEGRYIATVELAGGAGAQGAKTVSGAVCANESWRLSGVRFSARALLATGVGPAAAGGAALGIVFEARGARLGVALQGWRTGRIEAQGVRARFERLSARLDGCPTVLALSEWATVEPCPFVELGVVAGEAFEDPPAVIRGNRGSAPWYAAGGLGRFVGRFGQFVVELEGAAGGPLRRERFYVEGGDEIHRVPAYYGAFAGGLGVVF
jgi:hypothetical protein